MAGNWQERVNYKFDEARVPELRVCNTEGRGYKF